jgi:uncharacterized protein YbaR (Trm112 family)
MALRLVDFVLCPACSGTLLETDGVFACEACKKRFPPLGRVPCLLPDAEHWRSLWRAQLAVIHEEAERTVATFETELRKPGLLAETRARLEQQIGLTRTIVTEIDDALVGPVGAPAPLGTPLPGFQPLETLHLLHRDWGWAESDENERALACVERALSAPLGKTLVLGAGACRLAYDLHLRHHAEITIALDIDPLVLTLADRIVRGERVPLTEARSNATEITRLGALRTLSAPEGEARGLFLVLANGLAPPFRDHAFDTVVTPWFIDLVPPDMRDALGPIHKLLAPGGRWLDYGPLLYPLSRPAASRFSREEVFEMAHRAGFEIEKTTSELLPYSLSPLAERGRLELCIAFSARAVDPPADAKDPPSFIVLPHLPVPDFPGRSLFVHESAALRAVVELIDGKRSINDIARAITERAGTNPAAIKDTIRFCLLETHPACRPERA